MAQSVEALLSELKDKNPGKVFAKNRTETAIAVLHEDQWVGVYSQLLGGMGWAPYPAILADGQPLNSQADWIEA